MRYISYRLVRLSLWFNSKHASAPPITRKLVKNDHYVMDQIWCKEHSKKSMHVKDGCFRSQPIAGESTKLVSPRLEFLDLGSNQINGVFLDLKLLILRSNPFRGVVMEGASSQNRVWVSEAAQYLPFSKYFLYPVSKSLLPRLDWNEDISLVEGFIISRGLTTSSHSLSHRELQHSQG